MRARRVLAAASAVQLAAGLAGQVVALRRRRSFDITVLRGDPAHMVRDSLWGGTGLSAPVHMLAAQAWATAQVAAGHDPRARQVLLVLGTVMVPGYLGERLCRLRLTPGGFDRVETPIVVVGLAGAAAMVAVGRSGP